MRPRLLSAAALGLALLLAAPASAYVIYLKGNGGQVAAREKPTVQGKYLVFYTPLGAMQKIPLADYDEKKTTEMNAQGTGDAYILGDAPQEKEPSAESKPSLSQYIQIHKKGTIGEEKKPVEVAKESKGGVTTAGALDPQVEAIFLRNLENFGVKAPRVVAAPGGVRVQGIAETEEQLFAALKGIAKSVTDARTQARPVPKADIYLSTTAGDSAGHYEMSADDADAITSGRKTPLAWFMANVIL